MLELPTLIPAGTSYVRIPRSKTATMRILLETVQRGSRYWTGDVIDISKAISLAEKFAHLYATDARQSKRSWDKAHGRTNSMLIMYPEDDKALTPIRWWLLVTPGSGLAHKEERLLDTWDRRQRLTWGEQYALACLQKDRNFGGGRHWTWQLTDARYGELEAAMRQRASAHGGRSVIEMPTGILTRKQTDRQDDLTALVSAIRRMPGFHGIRLQQIALYMLGRECWNRTHPVAYLAPAGGVVGGTIDAPKKMVSGWPEDVPYVDKRQLVYHRPEPLRLDVLTRICMLRRRQGDVD